MIIEANGLTINQMEQTVSYNGAEIMLTNREFQILYVLAEHPGWVFSKQQIYSYITDGEELIDYHTIEISISRIREKLKRCTGRDGFIITVRERGYKLKK